MVKDKQAKRTAVVYQRTSTKGQADRATIEMQETVTARLVAEHDLEVILTIRDPGKSARLLEKRGAFASFIASVRSGTIKPDFLVVYSASRISRVDTFNTDPEAQIQSETDEALINSVLRSHGVKVIDPEGIHSDLRTKNINSSTEIKDTRRRTMDGKARCLAEGRWAKGGKPSYGYKQVLINPEDRSKGWTWKEHPEEGPILRQIFRWYAETNATETAKRATAAGYKTPLHKTKRASKPTEWTAVTIQHLTKKARNYMGEVLVTFDGTPYKLTHDAIIDEALCLAVERRVKEQTLKRRAVVLSTGFAVCEGIRDENGQVHEFCGEPIHARTRTPDTWTTRCAKDCGRMAEAPFTKALWAIIVARWIGIYNHGASKPRTADGYASRLKDLEAKINDVQRGIDEALQMRLDHEIDRPTWEKQHARLAEKKGKLTSERDDLAKERDAATRKAKQEADIWTRIQDLLIEYQRPDLPLETKRKALADLLQGERLKVSWPPKIGKPTRGNKPGPAMVTLPAWGDLPALTVPIDENEHGLKILGAAFDVLGELGATGRPRKRG